MPELLLEKRGDGVALITLNRPEALNALGGTLPGLFGEALAECRGDAAVRCVAITGAGRGFCSGGDVRGMGAMLGDGMAQGVPAQDDIDGSVAMFKAFQDTMILSLCAFPKPTVALVNGPAAGGGMGLALACDLRLCSDRARFVTAFRDIGLSEDCGVGYFLERLVGRGVALELMYLGEPVDAERAMSLRLVNRVFAHDDLLAQGLAFCADLARGPTAAFARMKANLSFAETSDLGAVLDREALFWKVSQLGGDHREAVSAFLERRKPTFTGK